MKRQWLSLRAPGDAVAVVRRLAGVQAQVPSAAVAAIALRQGSPQPGEVDQLLTDRALMRTWAMRGTLHLLASDDASAYLSLLAASRTWEKASWQRTFLDLDDMQRLTSVVGELLDGPPMTRAELVAGVGKRSGDQALADHVSSGWGAVLKPLAWQGVLCNGPSAGGRVTFTRPDIWIDGWPGLPPPEEAAPLVVGSYLGAFGPASPATFDQWLTRGASGKASVRSWFADLGDRLAVVDVEGQELYARSEDVDDLHAARNEDTVRLLPAFDQYVLGPGTADVHVLAASRRPVVSRAAGWISPVVVARGRIAGTWQVADHRIDIALFIEAGDVSRRAIDEEVDRLGAVAADHYTASVTTV
ncbi:MAG TPA: winged helix DNA-binding domain-containing protein [Acidimicrobiales bacterium]|jgi:hypothetical protein|nr:winged helix DNA-binding domain-containing protein [Acidimicrobiales bacterium]